MNLTQWCNDALEQFLFLGFLIENSRGGAQSAGDAWTCEVEFASIRAISVPITLQARPGCLAETLEGSAKRGKRDLQMLQVVSQMLKCLLEMQMRVLQMLKHLLQILKLVFATLERLV